jgi:hypothetical protein
MICGKRGRSKDKTLPRKSSFFRAREQKTRAGAGFDRDLLWFLFLFGRRKRKRKPNQEQITSRTASRLLLRITEKDSLGENLKNPMTI